MPWRRDFRKGGRGGRRGNRIEKIGEKGGATSPILVWSRVPYDLQLHVPRLALVYAKNNGQKSPHFCVPRFLRKHYLHPSS
eukprot:SAG31_NODE_902_length_11133_cov_4.169386_3_plen_81_part_00